MSDPFARYLMPPAIADGVTIELEGTPAVFTIKPPSNNYDAFYSAFSAALTEGRKPGETNISTAEMLEARKRAFLEVCITKADGLPDGMGAQAFFKAYPLALKQVFRRAVEAADELDMSLEEGLGNLSGSQPGPINGEIAKTSTKKSRKRESSPPRTSAPN